MSNNLKQVLIDLESELSGELLTEIVEVRGRSFEMRLLTEEETTWSFGLIKANNQIEIALSARLANLAVGIRSINEVPVREIFDEDIKDLFADEKGEIPEDLDLNLNLFVAKKLFEYLKELPPSFIGELHEKWQDLMTRQAEAQGNIKNS